MSYFTASNIERLNALGIAEADVVSAVEVSSQTSSAEFGTQGVTVACGGLLHTVYIDTDSVVTHVPNCTFEN